MMQRTVVEQAPVERVTRYAVAPETRTYVTKSATHYSPVRQEAGYVSRVAYRGGEAGLVGGAAGSTTYVYRNGTEVVGGSTAVTRERHSPLRRASAEKKAVSFAN